MKYYDYDDTPATVEEGKVPRLHRNGKEIPFYDTGRFYLYAQPISKAEFDTMVGKQQASGAT